MAAVLNAIACGAVYAAPVTPAANEIVNNKDEFISATTGNIFYDGTGTAEITNNISKNSNLYVRDGELKFTADENGTKPNVSLGNFAVSGNNAELTFDKANYSSNAALNHVGGVDGNGTLNITDSTFTSDAELFTIGVQGAGNGSEGSNYNGAGNGSGVVNITNSTAKLTYRHLQMGNGTLNVDNSNVTVGNQAGGSEYYKGFKATLGVGENSVSAINVSNGGNLTVCASQNDKYLGGFSTNYSDGSVTSITVDGGTFSVVDPENKDENKYPEGRPGNAYIGFSFESEIGTIPSNTKTVIDVKNGGEMNFNNHTTDFGYAGMADKGSSVAVTVYENSALNINGKDFSMNEGTTLNNSGTVSIDSHYANNRMANGEMFYSENPAAIKGGELTNNATGTINVINGIGFGDAAQSLKVDNKGTISSGDEVEIKGSTEFSNAGTLSAAGDITITGNANFENTGLLDTEGYLHLTATGGMTNAGTIEGTTWIHGDGAQLTAVDGSTMQTVFLYNGSLVIEGAVNSGKISDYGVGGGEIVFTMDGVLNMNGKVVSLTNTDIVLLVDFDITDGDLTSDFSFLQKDDFFINAGATTFGSNTTIVLRDSEGHEAVREVASIPEPTTATLSLLALAALAARRRRK